MQVQLPAAIKTKLHRCLCKRREGYSAALTWENSGLPSQRPSPLPAQALVLTVLGRGRLFFYPIILLTFGILRPFPFIFPGFGMCSVRKAPGVPWLSMVSGSVGEGGDCRTSHQEAWKCHSLCAASLLKWPLGPHSPCLWLIMLCL